MTYEEKPKPGIRTAGCAEAGGELSIPAVRTGNLLFLSGVLPMRNGQLAFTGKLGRELTVLEGIEASKVAILNALAIAKQELGSLDRITRVVKVVGHVASADGFTEQPQVLNGASDLLVAIFGEADAMRASPLEPPNFRVAPPWKSKSSWLFPE